MPVSAAGLGTKNIKRNKTQTLASRLSSLLTSHPLQESFFSPRTATTQHTRSHHPTYAHPQIHQGRGCQQSSTATRSALATSVLSCFLFPSDPLKEIPVSFNLYLSINLSIINLSLFCDSVFYIYIQTHTQISLKQIFHKTVLTLAMYTL